MRDYLVIQGEATEDSVRSVALVKMVLDKPTGPVTVIVPMDLGGMTAEQLDALTWGDIRDTFEEAYGADSGQAYGALILDVLGAYQVRAPT